MKEFVENEFWGSSTTPYEQNFKNMLIRIHIHVCTQLWVMIIRSQIKLIDWLKLRLLAPVAAKPKIRQRTTKLWGRDARVLAVNFKI